MSVAIADFVTFEECLTAARKAIEGASQGVAKQILGPTAVEFCVVLAARVAWECAAEATKRAQK